MSTSDRAQQNAAEADSALGDYIVLNGRHLNLEPHPTDFSALIPARAARDKAAVESAQQLSVKVSRVKTKAPSDREAAMAELRREVVAHHIYRERASGEELIIDDHIFLTLQLGAHARLEEIARAFHLEPEGRLGEAYVLRLTDATGANPVKTANRIAALDGVAACSPQVLLPLRWCAPPSSATHQLLGQQWYLNSSQFPAGSLEATAGIEAPAAWALTLGDPSVVIAVLDDGFDLEHPALPRITDLHPEMRNFAAQAPDENVRPDGNDYHGTAVASLAAGTLGNGGMAGVAPNCRLLLIRIRVERMAEQIYLRDVFRYVSTRADVVNCSFAAPPTHIRREHTGFREELEQMTHTGGRRGRGLVLVFAAGNDDAPTSLAAAQNIRGIKYVDFSSEPFRLAQVFAHQDVMSGLAWPPGAIVVGASSSRKRKAGYSNWGPELTLCAPSDNRHFIITALPAGTAGRDEFLANYPGLKQVAAVNRPGQGRPFFPALDDVGTPDFPENFYTSDFGGTSGAAPLVAGVAALMLSVNRQLTAAQVKQILIETADQDLDPTLDLLNDPNLQVGLRGDFIAGRSLFFGAGKVNARRAVRRARDLA